MKPFIENGKEGAWIRGVWHPNNYNSEIYVSKMIKEVWFVNDADNQFTLHYTEQDAIDDFLRRIEYEREMCQDEGEWNTDVEYICWGKLSQDVVLRKVPSPYNDGIDRDDEDYDTADYYEAFARERRIGCQN
jgi:hypothetical protein